MVESDESWHMGILDKTFIYQKEKIEQGEKECSFFFKCNLENSNSLINIFKEKGKWNLNYYIEKEKIKEIFRNTHSIDVKCLEKEKPISFMHIYKRNNIQKDNYINFVCVCENGTICEFSLKNIFSESVRVILEEIKLKNKIVNNNIKKAYYIFRTKVYCYLIVFSQENTISSYNMPSLNQRKDIKLKKIKETLNNLIIKSWGDNTFSSSILIWSFQENLIEWISHKESIFFINLLSPTIPKIEECHKMFNGNSFLSQYEEIIYVSKKANTSILKKYKNKGIKKFDYFKSNRKDLNFIILFSRQKNLIFWIPNQKEGQFFYFKSNIDKIKNIFCLRNYFFIESKKNIYLFKIDRTSILCTRVTQTIPSKPNNLFPPEFPLQGITPTDPRQYPINKELLPETMEPDFTPSSPLCPRRRNLKRFSLQ